MNYIAQYMAIIERANGRSLSGYAEKHHIIPRCVGGDDAKENIVSLTAREHFVAHQLLVKIYPHERGLSWAAMLMAGKEKFKSASSREYEWLKRVAAKHISESAKSREFKETPAMRSAWQKRVGVPLSHEHRASVSRATKGKKVSVESRDRMRESALKRAPMSELTRAKVSASLMGNSRRKGIPNTPEVNAKSRAVHLGRRQSKEEKDRRGRSIRRITDECIRTVREVASRFPSLTHQEVADRSGTSKTQVGRILRREMYGDVA